MEIVDDFKKDEKEIQLERLLSLYATVGAFDFGTIFRIGENIWAQKLPDSYVQRDDRCGHPGICVSKSEGIMMVVPMLYGTSNEDKRSLPLNIDGEDPKRLTYFGHFNSVEIPLTAYERNPTRRVWDKKDRKDVFMRGWNGKNKLTSNEIKALRAF